MLFGEIFAFERHDYSKSTEKTFKITIVKQSKRRNAQKGGIKIVEIKRINKVKEI